jgi:hypothetical protein
VAAVEDLAALELAWWIFGGEKGRRPEEKRLHVYVPARRQADAAFDDQIDEDIVRAFAAVVDEKAEAVLSEQRPRWTAVRQAMHCSDSIS